MRSALISEAEMNALLYSGVIQTEEMKLSSAPNLYFPLDPMVINLADTGGDRTAQVVSPFKFESRRVQTMLKKYCRPFEAPF